MVFKKPDLPPAQALDRHLGGRLALRRRELGMSHAKLDKAIWAIPGTTARFESGAMKMDAARLFILSRVLKVPVLYFFENSPVLLQLHPEDVPNPETVGEVERFLDAYFKISDPRLRRDILSLLKAAADDRKSKSA